MEHYYSLNQYFKETFGCKGYKVSLRGGMTCPNRDGTLGTRGCLFCSGAGEFAADGETVTEQIERAAKRIESKNKNGTYIAYFQDYTNTYAPVEQLRAIFTEVIRHPRVSVLSVATRPDCLPAEVLSLLSELNLQKPVWVELGLQTIHEQTAERIRRGYRTEVYDRAVKELHERGIQVITHVIIGLPGETPDMIYETVKHLAEVGTDGVKFHLLHIVDGTDLASEYRKGLIPTLSFPEYLEILEHCLRLLPPETVVHRLTGDGDKKTLIAPLWSADKKHVLNAMKKRFDECGLKQGELFVDKRQKREYNSENAKQKGNDRMLMILSGFSGAGKNTVINELLSEENSQFRTMPTYTTRAMREGEREGKPYCFLTMEQFEQKIAEGELYEYEFIHKSYYGSSRKLLAEALQEGKTVIKDIDVKGALNLKRLLTDQKVVTVFLYVEEEELRRRLVERGDAPEDIDLRMKRLTEEMAYMKSFDYQINNLDLAETVGKIKAIAEQESKS